MGTFGTNILPNTTGLDLGTTNQRWDLFAQNVNATQLLSGTTNPALSGLLRLADSDAIAWRNFANNADDTLAMSGAANGTVPADVLTWNGNGFRSPTFISGSSNPSSAGTVRLAHSDSVSWRNAANSGDGPVISVNGSDQIVFSSVATIGSLSSLNVKTLNRIEYADQYPGATADVQINAAAAVVAANGGGIVDCRGYGATSQTIAATITIGNSTGICVTLLIDRATTFNITITNGTNAIELWKKSCIVGEGAHGDGPSGTGGLHLNSSANVSAIIATKPNTGTFNTIKGVTLSGDNGATVVRGLLDLVSQVDLSTFEDILIGPPSNSIGLRIENVSGGSVGPLNINNFSINGNARAGVRPVQINCVNGGGVTGTINFFGGSFTHPGTGGLPIIDIQGGTTNLIEGVGFYGCQFESSNAGDIGINIVNGKDIHIQDALFTSNITTGADCIKISQSGGVSYNITLDNITNFNGWTNTLNDTVSGITIVGATDPRIARYTFVPPTNSGGFRIVGKTGTGEIFNANQTNLQAGVPFSKYNGLTLAGNGMASEVAVVDLTAQTAAVGTTTLYAVTVAGQYRLSWNAKVTTAAGTSSTLGALTIVYTDPDGVAQTITAAAQVAAGTIATTNAGNTTASVLLGLPILINAKASTNITYAFAYASNAANAMNYNLHLRLEAM